MPNGLTGVAALLASDGRIPPQRSIMAEFSLESKVIVITGGHRGLGREMALACAEAGGVVYCLDLHPAPDEEWITVKSFVDALPYEGEQADKSRLEYMSCNVTDQAAVWSCFEKIATKEGKLDVCIAAAGILKTAHCLEQTGEEFDTVMNINVNGVLYAAQGAAKQMIRLNRPGSIILISSKSGIVGNANQPWTAYSASKAAVIQLARSMACELGANSIRVNALSPGSVNTKMTQAGAAKDPSVLKKVAAGNPLGRLGNPEEFRGVVVWLASNASSFCTGSNIVVDGGHTAW